MRVMSEAIRDRLPGPRPLPPRTERELQVAARNGQPVAFERIFARHHQELYRYCRSILGDHEDAQDALQSTMMSALRSLPGEPREIELRPWLFRVAHNNAISIARRRARERRAEGLERVPDPRSGSDLESRERLRALVADLALLSARQRGALTMRELSGLSFDEIAGALAISPQAARQVVYEARVALRELERGREMDCDRVCALVSAGDRRRLRGRRIRAHLRSCASCRRFQDAIGRRRADLAALAPPLGAGAAGGLLASLLGAGAGSGVTSLTGAGVLGLVGKGIGPALAAKVAGSVVAATAIGVGAADLAGVIEVPLPRLADPALVATQPGGASSEDGAPSERDLGVTAGGRDLGGRDAAGSHGPGPGGEPGSNAAGSPSPSAAPSGSSVAHGAGGGHGPPEHSSAGGNPPAHSGAGGNPPAHSGAGGNPPAHSSAGGAPPEHSSAGGNPPAHSSAGGTPTESPPAGGPATGVAPAVDGPARGAGGGAVGAGAQPSGPDGRSTPGR